MKTIISTLLMIFFSSLILIAQSNLDSLIPKSHVKSIYEIRYEFEDGIKKSVDTVGYKLYNQDFKLVKEFSRFYSYIYQYEYSSNGLLTKKIELNNQNDEEVERVWLYEYVDENRLRKEISYWTNFKRKYITLYEYDKQNHLVTKNELNHKNEIAESTSEKFYETGELYEIRYEEKYNKSAFNIRRFDKCGNLIYHYENGKEQYIYSFISLCPNFLKTDTYLVDTLNNEQYIVTDNYRKSVYKYDHIGNLVSVAKFQFAEDEILNRSEEKTYNQKGQLISLKEFYHWSFCGYEPPKNKTTIQEKYEYYSNGLLHKVHHQNETNSDKTNFVLNHITEYQIEYHD